MPTRNDAADLTVAVADLTLAPARPANKNKCIETAADTAPAEKLCCGFVGIMNPLLVAPPLFQGPNCYLSLSVALATCVAEGTGCRHGWLWGGVDA